jgi:hypothetical protein
MPSRKVVLLKDDIDTSNFLTKGEAIENTPIGNKNPSTIVGTKIEAKEGFKGNLEGTLTGKFIGNASTASKLEKPVLVNGVEFDGSKEATLPVNIANDPTLDKDVFPVWVNNSDGNTQAFVSKDKLSFNPNSGILTATEFKGNLNGTIGDGKPATIVGTIVVAKNRFVGDLDGEIGKNDIAPGNFTNLSSKGKQVVKITDVNNAEYDLRHDDYILNVIYTATNKVKIKLLSNQLEKGRILVVKDAGLSASRNSIVIEAEGADRIDGKRSIEIRANGQAVNLYCDGFNWFVYSSYKFIAGDWEAGDANCLDTGIITSTRIIGGEIDAVDLGVATPKEIVGTKITGKDLIVANTFIKEKGTGAFKAVKNNAGDKLEIGDVVVVDYNDEDCQSVTVSNLIDNKVFGGVVAIGGMDQSDIVVCEEGKAVICVEGEVKKGDILCLSSVAKKAEKGTDGFAIALNDGSDKVNAYIIGGAR